MEKLEHVTNWEDLKSLYVAVNENEYSFKIPNNNYVIRPMKEEWQHSSYFYGPSYDQVKQWLRDGYVVEGLALDEPLSPLRKRRKLKYAEEGELQLDLAWSGHDFPFIQWDQRESRQGLTVNIQYCFSAMTPLSVIQEYLKFVLQVLIALESAGFDLEIQVYCDSPGMFTDCRESLLNYIRVKKSGEQSDFLSWSAFMSPGGYRHLMFFDFIYAGDDLGHSVSSGLGGGTNNAWNINFDSLTGVIDFQSPFHAKSFPKEELEIQLRSLFTRTQSRS